jgi:uncharacterized protein (TIGR02996 family)
VNESEFLEAIRRDPEAVEPYSVYADWLADRGDPRGELIALQVEARRSPDDPRWRAAEERLFREHGEALLGPNAALVKARVLSLEWRLGFVKSARFTGGEPGRLGGQKRVEYLEALLVNPLSWFLERIEIGDWWVAQDRVFDAELIALRRAPKTLRTLIVRPWGARDVAGRLFALEACFAAHPQLVELELGGESVSLPRKIELPALESLLLQEHRPSYETFAAITANEWPSLARLSILSSGAPYAAELGGLFDGGRTPELALLTLHGAIRATWPVVEAIARSRLLRRLERLELTRCHLDDFGAQEISRRRDAFAHLDLLNLDGNDLTDEGVEAVRMLECPVIVGSQRGVHYD